MALSGFDKAAVSGVQYPFRVQVAICADDGTWCDINKEYPQGPQDTCYRRLIALPALRQQSEVRPGRFATSISDLKLDDHDSMFAAESWTLYDSSGDSHTLASWYNARVKISVSHHVDSQSEWTSDTLGVFALTSIERSLDKTATVKLSGLERKLMDTSAATFKNGGSPPINIPCQIAIQRLVDIGSDGSLAFESGSPPDDMTIASASNYAGILGNVPGKASEDNGGDWSESQDFVPRWIESAGDKLFFFGYSKKNNKPAACYWHRGEEQWSAVETVTPSSGVGWEFVFAHAGSGDYANKFIAVAITCSSGSATRLEAGCYALGIYSVDTSDASIMDLSVSSAVWPCNHIAMRPHRVGLHSFTGMVEDNVGRFNPGVFFPSVASSPGVDDGGSYDWKVYAKESSTTSEHEPTRLMHATDPPEVPWQDSNLAAWDEDFAPGFYTFHRSYVSGYTYPVYFKTHDHIQSAFKYCSRRNDILWLNFDFSSGRWRVAYFDCGTGRTGLMTITHPAEPTGTTDEDKDKRFYRYMPTAFHITDGAVQRIYLSTISLYDANAAHPYPQGEYIQAYLKSGILDTTISMTTTLVWTPTTTIETNKGQRYCPLIISIDILELGATVLLYGQVLNWWAANGTCYGLWYWRSPFDCAVFASGNGYTPTTSAPMVISTGNSGACIYALDQGSGTLWYGRPNGTMAPITDGMPVDGENTWAATQLYIDTGSTYGDTLYVVSASTSPADCHIRLRYATDWSSGNPNLGSYSPSGRTTLWTYGHRVAAVIPVADFGDVSCWDALEQIRVFCGDYIMGINSDGDFYFKRRPSSATALTIKSTDGFVGRDGTEIPALKLATKLDVEHIANSFAVPLYLGERSAVAVDMILTSDSKADGIMPVAAQLTNESQRVVLYCINAGSLDTDVGDAPLLFAWRKVLADISGILSSAATKAATTLYMYGIFEGLGGTYQLGDATLSVGDTVQIGDSNFIEISAIAEGMLTLADEIGGSGDHPKGSQVRIRPKDSSRYSDSADGVCKVTQAFTIGTSGEISVLTVDDTERLSHGMYLSSGSGGVQVLEVLSDTTARVKAQPNGVGGGNSNGTWAIDTVLSGYIWIRSGSATYTVSNTGVNLTFAAPDDNIYRNARFEVGDRIVITCGGLTNKKLDHAIYRASNSTSIERYGTKEYKMKVENRLMTGTRAKILFAYESDLASPSWVSTATVPLLVSQSDIGPGARVAVCSPYLWPYEPDNTVAHNVMGWTANLNIGTLTLSLRSVTDTIADGQAGAAWDRHAYFGRR